MAEKRGTEVRKSAPGGNPTAGVVQGSEAGPGAPASCRYCFNTWKPGGDWHKPDCLILTGNISTLALLRKRHARAKKRPGIESEIPKIEKLEGF